MHALAITLEQNMIKNNVVTVLAPAGLVYVRWLAKAPKRRIGKRTADPPSSEKE